jgi:hypothetical protein
MKTPNLYDFISRIGIICITLATAGLLAALLWRWIP